MEKIRWKFLLTELVTYIIYNFKYTCIHLFTFVKSEEYKINYQKYNNFHYGEREIEIATGLQGIKSIGFLK